MKLMRKYRVFVCAVLILCFFSFQISRPRQALAIVPAVSLAAAAVLAVGAAAGLSYTFDNADAESIAGRLQAFLDDVHPGTAIADYFSARGAAVKDGLMYIGRSLYNRIKEFLQWEVSENNLSAGSSAVVSSSTDAFYTYDDITINCSDFFGNDYVYDTVTTNYNYQTSYLSSTGQVWNIDNSWLIDEDIYIKLSDVVFLKYYTATSGSSHRLQCDYTTDGGATYTNFQSVPITDYRSTSTKTFGVSFFLSYMENDSTVLVPRVLIANFTNTNSSTPAAMQGKPKIMYYQTYIPLTASDWLGFTASAVAGQSLSLTASDVISYPDVADGQSVCVDVGMLTGSTIDEVSDEIIDAAIDGTLSPSISAETWTVDVVTTPQELAQDLDQDLTTDVEDNPTVPDTERIEFDPPAHYTIRDLRTFFPFCIPFDLFDMLGVLAAQPVAPHFEYRFQPGIANIDYTIVIDFQQFDSVALLLRRLETLSFCIGLAMVTRNLIRG